MKKIIAIWEKDYIRCLRDFNLLLWLPMVSCVVMIALKLNSLYIDEDGKCSKGKNENSKKDTRWKCIGVLKKKPQYCLLWNNQYNMMKLYKCSFVLFSLFSQTLSQTHTFVRYMYYDFDFKIYKSKKNCFSPLEMWHLKSMYVSDPSQIIHVH